MYTNVFLIALAIQTTVASEILNAISPKDALPHKLHLKPGDIAPLPSLAPIAHPRPERKPFGLPYRSIQQPLKDWMLENGKAHDHFQLLLTKFLPFVYEESNRWGTDVLYTVEGIKAFLTQVN